MNCSVPACGGRARYVFVSAGAGPAGRVPRCWRHGLSYGPVVRRALRVATLVGTVLFAINQADVVLGGELTPRVAAKVLLTYLVPFCVSIYSALEISRLPGEPDAPGGP